MEFCGSCGTDIRYARVGASTYGSPTVESEGVPLTGAALFVIATPNPAVGLPRVIVRALVPAVGRVEMHDVLGRRVALLHDGPVSAGSTALSGPALPSGV
jgi:hypothetical protein